MNNCKKDFYGNHYYLQELMHITTPSTFCIDISDSTDERWSHFFVFLGNKIKKEHITGSESLTFMINNLKQITMKKESEIIQTVASLPHKYTYDNQRAMHPIRSKPSIQKSAVFYIFT